jgi:hypothetical protein
MAQPENPPAFPSIEEHPSYDMPMHHFGMSLRDWFAGQALAGMYANAYHRMVDGDYRVVGFANDAFETADAMLAVRARVAP